MLIGEGCCDSIIDKKRIEELVKQSFLSYNFKNKKVLVIIPDNTRSAPVGLFFKLFYFLLINKVKKLDFLIALGTHPPLSFEQINKLIGISFFERKEKYKNINIFNHKWDDPSGLCKIGEITKEEIEELSEGLCKEKVTIVINKLIFNYEILIIISPVFPHEVVGFSGGNKYFFPGIAGPEIIHFFHWLGALITSPQIIGKKYTIIRKIINKASSFIKLHKLCFGLVVSDKGLNGLYIGTPEEAYEKAADLSNHIHIIYKEKPFKQVLASAPKMYDDIWTAGKCMYKLESVVENGGELIIYAPHIREISYTHGKIIDQIGYHIKDYFLTYMDRFKNIPKAIMAHSTHVKGIGIFKNNKEFPRIKVTLATGISKERCEKVNLGYKDFKKIDLIKWQNKEKEGILFVSKAGEILYQLKTKRS